MKKLPNIEKSLLRKGEYLGHACGVWLIKRTNSTYGNWIARHRDDPRRPIIYAFTLDEMSKKLSVVPLYVDTAAPTRKD